MDIQVCACVHATVIYWRVQEKAVLDFLAEALQF